MERDEELLDYEEWKIQKEKEEIINLFRKGEISPYRDYFTYKIAKKLFDPLLPDWIAVGCALTRAYPPSSDPNP